MDNVAIVAFARVLYFLNYLFFLIGLFFSSCLWWVNLYTQIPTDPNDPLSRSSVVWQLVGSCMKFCCARIIPGVCGTVFRLAMPIFLVIVPTDATTSPAIVYISWLPLERAIMFSGPGGIGFTYFSLGSLLTGLLMFWLVKHGRTWKSFSFACCWSEPEAGPTLVGQITQKALDVKARFKPLLSWFPDSGLDATLDVYVWFTLVFPAMEIFYGSWWIALLITIWGLLVFWLRVEP
jgi:hypothetical protein